jgi:hypothetical protein
MTFRFITSDAVCCPGLAESDTVTVTEADPAVVVPVIIPDVFIRSPAGKLLADHE